MASNSDGGGAGGGGSNGALSGGSFSKRRRCDHRSGEHHLEMDYYREQQQQRALMEDVATMRTRYADLANENQQLQQENQRLKELASSGNAGTDSLFISHTQALSKLEVAQDENARLVQKCDLLERELQSSNAKLMRALKEFSKQKEAHQKLQQQYDEAINFKIKAHKDMSRLTDERNAAMAEYNLIMSERDTVHKEMEKLSDDAAQARKSIKMLDADNKELQADKRQLTYQLESLRREIASALHERDKALKECNELRDAIGAGGELKSRGADAAYDTQSRGGRRLSDTLSQAGEGGGGRKGEQFLRDEHRSEKRLDNLDQANQELEALRKSLDKAQAELAEAVQEAEVSKGRRDWAFSERDKIVLERESIRTLCDNMRKERDRAVSDLAEALRESDAIKKQRNELLKESKALREALESAEQQLSASSPVGGGGGGQVTKWIHTAALPPNCHGLSLTLGVYINRIADGSGAARDKSLTVGDRVLKINDKNMDDIESTHEAMRALEEAASTAPSDVINITTLKMSYPECPNVFTPIRRYNRACQTDSDLHLSPSDYKLSSNQEKNSGAWLKEKLDIMRGRRGKDDKKKYRNSSPNPLEFGEAIAELDSVLDSHSHSPSSSSHAPSNAFSSHASGKTGTIQRKRQNAKEEDKNGGTWPKARAPHVLSISNASATPGGGTVGGRRKERPALSLLNQDYCRNSTPVTLSLAPPPAFSPPTLTGRHSVYKSVDATPHFKIVADSFERLRIGTVQRLSANTDSLEFNRGFEFYGGKAHEKGVPEKSGRDGTLEKGRDFNYLDKGAYTASKDSYGNKHSFGGDRGSYGAKSSYSSDKVVFHDKANCFSMDKSIGAPLDKSLSRSKYSDPEHLRSESLLSPEVGHLRGHSHLHMPPARVVVPYQFYPHPHPQLNHSRESFSFEPIVHHQQHIHSPSSILEAGRPATLLYDAIGGGTIPRKREQRFRVPSNPSVTSKVSNGSIERGSSERGSPMPFFQVEVLSSPGDHGGGAVPQAPPPSKDCCSAHKPVPGELRRVRIDKSNEPLGIQINCPDTGGIFVSTVTDNSLASRVGLQIGDQLLEVCGINMRNATYNLAANVLRQCGNSITMLVQYSPDKYNELEGASEGRNSERGGASCSGSTSNEESEEEDAEEEEEEEEATPCNSPKEVRKQATLQRANQRVVGGVAAGGVNNGVGGDGEEPRYLYIETLKTSNLGISLVGGNAAGIFIHSVQPDSLAYHAGLRTGDQILEYNGSDLRMATAEEAAYELAKPADKVTVLAHYRIERYNEIKDKPGDSLYVRCGFDRSGSEHTEPPQLAFNKDDVLYVDNTMFNGVPGQWRAWRLDGEGHRQQCGVIPSKYKVEEELLLRRGGIAASSASDNVEGRAPTRRSFFRKKKRNSTLGVGSTSTGGGGKELASFCNLSPGWYSDSGSLHEDLSLMSYQRVERLQYPEFRPVLVLGPLAECVADKLVSEFPDKFQRASTDTRRCSQALLDRELADGLIVEYRRRGTVYECTTVAAVRAVIHNQHHCMLDGGIAVVERLHRHHIYPVVLLIKFKSTKAIREVKDARYSLDKLSGKAAKEMFEHGTKLEEEYRNLMTAVVAAGANVAHMCAQVKAAVDAEHRKSQWVPAASLH